jgi:phosphatidylserine/phosphatidylglycerophosphate/cardiolipin synthase-like enzyme
VKLIIQPGDGVERLIRGLEKAKEEVKIVIFRFDRDDLERALIEAAERGVFVHALIAFTNRGGEEHLRKLEMHFLAKGMTVARTAGDLVRYHGKMMIVDRKELYLLAFNFIHLDIDHSRSFGLVTRNPKLVQEALRLFDADTKRQEYVERHDKFLVSPVNARKELAAFLKGAEKELLIYDPKISDRAMLRVIEERRKSGVEVRLIGEVSGGRLSARKLAGLRLHTRTIIRDRKQAFVGSQSLRQIELDARREIGVIFRDPPTVNSLVRVFEDDWASAKEVQNDVEGVALPIGKTAKRVAKMVSKSLPVAPVVKQVIRSIKQNGNGKIGKTDVAEIVQAAVKEAVKDTVKEVTREVVKAAVEEAVEVE